MVLKTGPDRPFELVQPETDDASGCFFNSYFGSVLYLLVANGGNFTNLQIFMDNSINQEAIADNNASVNNNLPVDPPISNDATNPNPPNANDSQSQDMLDGVAGIGPGYKGPSYDKLRIHLLADLKRECQVLVDSSAWKETGCTLMADGLCFVKSINAFSIVKNASHLCNLFFEVIEWIGPNDIVHVVTDNAANYVAAGRLINRKYDHIYWSPSAAHCLNLMLKDISSIAHISNLATRASKITVFVYNHTVFLSWLRKRPHCREIVRPSATRFATVFITLKSIFDHKKDLQDDCFTVCKLVGPLIKLLRLVDVDDKSSLGYVYKGMLRAEDAIKEMFRQNKTAYQPYTDIINSRWDKHLKKDLHAAAYFLNPSFFFNENYKEVPDVMRGILDLVTLYCKCNNLDSVDAMKEIHLYRDQKESFDRPEAIRAASQLKPGEIDANLYQSGGGSSGLYAASLE
ncbi:uncharacterized protein LOC107488718 [Arachis duranensis]|uniref:Uncharacterized protein LOC107488718 n=1 Tax=Arachis duranensis TaxID=130453 RepID=A0A6P4DAF7_ARADU|nr:uncharacterized protein LOC107488718 [Arachis duranensis]